MRKQFTAFAKRALAFALALVLLLSLIPAVALTVDAAVDAEGWGFDSNYKKYFTTAQFISADNDLIFEDKQSYDWYVYFGHTYNKNGSTTKLSFSISATITDANGETIDYYETPSAVGFICGHQYSILDSTNFSKLTSDLAGDFTLYLEILYNGSKVAWLTKSFSRVSSNPLEVSVTSRSNPDKVFTFADPIDLVLNIKKSDGVATAYNAAVTVTNSSDTELLAARGISLPASTNTTLIVKDLVNLPSIKTAGTYKVNLTLTDANGNIQHQESYPFSVSGLVGSVNASITSDTSSSMTFTKNQTFDLTLNLEKTDGVAEDLIANITVTGSGSFSEKVTCAVPASGTFTYTPNLSSLTAVGDYTMTVVLTDDAGNARGSISVPFSRIDPMTLSFSFNSSNTGNIYINYESIPLSVRITHASSAGKRLTVKVTSSISGTEMETTKTMTLSSSGTTSTGLNSYMPYYGVYDSVTVTVYDHSTGKQLAQATYENQPFSRVLATANPGDLPLLNMNVHYTNISDTVHMTNQVDFSALASANMWRSTIRWDTVERTKGKYNMPSQLATVMDQTAYQDMQALIILAYNNDNKDSTGQKFYGDPDPTNPTWLNAYANYCYEVAKYMAINYADQVAGFEIWNEWNNSSMSKVTDENLRKGDVYAELVKAASAKIRQVNKTYGTNFKVIGGATSGDGSQTNTSTGEFIKAMLATSGFIDAIDGISFHTYSSLETYKYATTRGFAYVSPAEFDFVSRLKIFKGFLEDANAPDDLEIWITETGWSTNAEPEVKPSNKTTDGRTHYTTGATEEEQAAYMVQLHTWALADGSIDRIFWYDLLNDRNNASAWVNNSTESNYGLLHTWDSNAGAPLAYAAKPGYVAMCAFSSMLGGATYAGTVDLGDGVKAYEFTDKNDQTMVVAWTTSKTTKTLTCTGGKMTVTDMYGNDTSNLTTATLSECPIYIVCNSGSLSVG